MLLLIHDALRVALIPAEAIGYGIDDLPPLRLRHVRKPSGKEPAGCREQRCRGRYGDFDSAVEALSADDASDGMVTAPRGGGNEAGMARR
jgi:hypothetical protein